jgi:hypothetical protein
MIGRKPMIGYMLGLGLIGRSSSICWTTNSEQLLINGSQVFSKE